MVSRGGERRGSYNGYHLEEENKDDEEEEEETQVVEERRNTISVTEAARMRDAQYLAQEALRIAIEARHAARRLQEYRSRAMLLSHRRSYDVRTNDHDIISTSTLRGGGGGEGGEGRGENDSSTSL
jgi:Xaa-Pro aminopeptidase